MSNRFFLSFAAASFCCAAGFGCGGAQKSGEADEQADPEVVSEAEQYMGQAGLSESEGDTQGAFANYLAAAELYEKSGQITVERADAHFQTAVFAYKLAEREIAVQEYEKAVDIYMRFSGNARIKAATALNNMGTIYKETQNKSRALNCWNRALEIYRSAPPELKSEANVQKTEQNIRDLESGF